MLVAKKSPNVSLAQVAKFNITVISGEDQSVVTIDVGSKTGDEESLSGESKKKGY